MANHGRNNLLDAVKILMAFMVISIHTITPSTEFKYILTQGLDRIAVPFFFIASGYFFSKRPTRDNLYKNLIRLGCLYLAWCVFYLAFIVYDIHMASNSLLSSVLNSSYLLIKGWRHLWYMPAMILGIGMYFALNKTKYVFLIALILYALGMLIQNTVAQTQYSIIFYRNFITFGFPMISLGAFIRGVSSKELTQPILFLTLLAALLILLLESALKYNHGLYNNDLLLFGPIVASIALLITVKSNIKINHDLTGIATSMYFIHYFFYICIKGLVSSEYILFILVSFCALLSSVALLRYKMYRDYFI